MLVLRAALNHLLQIHEADIIQQIQAPPADADGDYDEDSRQTLYGLLDLVSIRGILPSLSPGVAAKHRPRSMIPSRRDVTPSSDKDSELLCAIVDGMSKMLENPGAGLAPLIRERALIDVVAGAGELAFAPDSGHDMHVKYGDIFVAIINKSASSISSCPNRITNHIKDSCFFGFTSPHISYTAYNPSVAQVTALETALTSSSTPSRRSTHNRVYSVFVSAATRHPR